jgi:iron complex outermembrane receptor protein
VGIPAQTVANIKNAIALNALPIDPVVLSKGSYAVTEFANGIDTVTQGADLTFQFPQDYSWGHVNWTIDGAYNDTYITKLPQTAPALAGYQLYSAGDTSVLTTASPHIRINFGAYWTLDKWSVNFTEHLIGPTHEYLNDGGLVNGLINYYPSQIDTAWLTDLSVGFKATKNVQITIGANNLFNKFPNHLNPQIVNAYYNADFSTGVQIQPIWSPYGINGGLYYGRVSLTW